MQNVFGRRNTKAAKLSRSQVQEIRERYERGETQRELGQAYGVSTGQIGRVVRGESWATADGGEYRPLSSPQALEDSWQRVMKRAAESEPEPLSTPRPVMPISPELAARRDVLLGRIPPPSLLEGGDAADETGGTGVEKLASAPTAQGYLSELKGEGNE